MKRVLTAMALTGCATSYQSATAHQPIGAGAFLITADGNGFTGSSTIEHYKYRRAKELCPGGFDVIDANQSTRTSLATFDGGKTYNTVNKPSGSLAVRCRARAVPTPEPSQSGWWCAAVALRDATGSVCARTESECKRSRARLREGDVMSEPCSLRPSAICFSAYHGPSGTSDPVCFVSEDDCAKSLETTKVDPQWTLESECRETK